MSLRVRRFAVVALAALVLTTAGAATALAAPARQAQTVASPDPDDYPGPDSHPDGRDRHPGRDRPLHFGPFDIPRSGTVSGGFSWNTRD